jgi:hypothetical protein
MEAAFSIDELLMPEITMDVNMKINPLKNTKYNFERIHLNAKS